MQLRVSDSRPPEVDEQLLKLNVRLGDGSAFEVDAAPGFHVVELIRMFGLPIKAECGGAGVCATCHVRIPNKWQRVLPPPSDEELAKLDEIPGVDDNSRLACQLVMSKRLDGLELEIQPDSLVPQTYWVYG